jgi:hypothetical protein
MRYSAWAALAFLTVAPALADPPGVVDENALAAQYSGRAQVDPLQAHLDACEKLMERAFYMDDPASLERAVDARREMELARDAFHQGDGFACTRHAIHALEDRT